MNSYLYHGSPAGDLIIESGLLICNSYPEYAFEVFSKVLSLTRCIRFADYYSKTERDDTMKPIIVVIDRDVLRTTHKITLGRSTLFDNSKHELTREECEEFVTKPIPLDHPAVVEIRK